MTARVLTWNLARKRPDGPKGARAIDHLFAQAPDVMVLTEARTTSASGTGHSLWCEPPRGSVFAESERKVLLWSQEPWTGIDRVGHDGLDQTRFVSATTQTPIGPVRVLGVCIPWEGAEVQYPIDAKRKRWELHLTFLAVLRNLIDKTAMPTIIAGDFNQQVPRVDYGTKAASAALGDAFSPMTIATAGNLGGTTRPGINHIACSEHFGIQASWGWPAAYGVDTLSDHEGAGVDLTLPETAGSVFAGSAG